MISPGFGFHYEVLVEQHEDIGLESTNTVSTWSVLIMVEMKNGMMRV